MKNKETRLCPKCHKYYNDYPAISRKDNKTEICLHCGQMEALEAVWKWGLNSMSIKCPKCGKKMIWVDPEDQRRYAYLECPKCLHRVYTLSDD